MQEVVINKTVLAMRLGLILAFSFVMQNIMSLFVDGEGIFSIVASFISIFFFIYPFVFLYRMTVNYCVFYNDCKYIFSTPFAISIKGFAFGGIFYTLYFYLYVKYFAPDYLINMYELYEKMLSGESEETLKELKDFVMSSTPKTLIMPTYLGFLIVGLFISLISVGLAKFAKLEKPVSNDFTAGNNDSNYSKS